MMVQKGEKKRKKKNEEEKKIKGKKWQFNLAELLGGSQ